MVSIRCETDFDACRQLWQKLIPPEKITDLWDVRACFHRSYQRDLFFVVAEDAGQAVGFMPLCWIPEQNCYGYFPGEVWKGTTWLEQNRIIARDRDVLRRMIDWLFGQKRSFHLRYLNDHSDLGLSAEVDETGYLFMPEKYAFSFEAYREQFSRKSIKALIKTEQEFQGRGLQYRLGCRDDYDIMVDLNVSRFADASYFSDPRFASGFRAVRDLLESRGWLRMVTALVEGRPAAVDFGIVYNNVYTLLAGGTHAGFPGIAKTINMFHIHRTCEEKYAEADFLCGDFFWKPMFHLTPRPLYVFSNMIRDPESRGI